MTQLLQLRSGTSGAPFVGTANLDTLLWDNTAKAWYVGAGGGGGAVSSVFGRVGAVVAATGDYDSDQVDNLSTVPGAAVSDALDYLLANAGAVASVFGRVGVVVATSGDYESDQVDNLSGVAGASVSDALDTLGARVTGVASVFGRAGAVVAATNDYTATQVQNSATVAPGASVAAALDDLGGRVVNYAIATNTLQAADYFSFVSVSFATACTYHFPADATLNAPIGTEVTVEQGGAGALTFVADGACVLHVPPSQSLVVFEQYRWVTWKKVAANTWHGCGGLA